MATNVPGEAARINNAKGLEPTIAKGILFAAFKEF